MKRLRNTLLVAALGWGGCLSPSAPVALRFYSIEPALPETEGNESTTRLRLRRVEGAQHLQNRIVWRRSDVEVGYHELDRWTELPVVYLREALEAQLFPSRFQRTESGQAPALDVELRAFEAAREPARGVRVVLNAVLLSADGNALAERTIEVRKPTGSDGLAASARALREALQEAVTELATLIESRT